MDLLETQISERIKYMMVVRKINQSDLAEELGIHQYDVSRMLNGKPFPSISQLVKIAQLLDTDLYYLIGIKEESYRELSPEAGKIAKAYINADPTIKTVIEKILLSL